MDHDELLEQAARELAAALEKIRARGTCPLCLGGLLEMVAKGLDGSTPQSNPGHGNAAIAALHIA